jgi:hypothetical protein
MMPGNLPRTKQQVTACERSFGHPHVRHAEELKAAADDLLSRLEQ